MRRLEIATAWPNHTRQPTPVLASVCNRVSLARRGCAFRYATPVKPIARFQSAIMSLGFVLLSGSAGWAETPARGAPQAQIPGKIRLERPLRAEDAIIVKLRLGDGEELPMKLDTGGWATFFDQSVAPRLGRRVRTMKRPFPFNSTPGLLDVYQSPKLYAGDTQLLTADQVFTTKLSPGGGYKGILGMDCLQHYCIQLDFVCGTLTFLDPDHLNPSDLGKSFPVRRGPQGITCFDADLFGQGKMRFLLDTGFTGPFDAMLAPKVFQRLLREQPTIGPDIYMSLGDGATYLGKIFPRLDLCGQTYTDLHFSMADWSNLGVKGTLGMRFLARHKVTLNSPTGTLYLNCVRSAPVTEDTSKLQSPPGGANRKQPSSSQTNSTLPAAASGRSR